jgi:protocatechuate 3,4-dioxygenase beta subunit
MNATEYQRFKGDRPAAHAAKPGLLKPTPPDILGPFYKEGAPFIFGGEMVADPTLHLSGRVMDTDGNPVGATLDFWQANEKGEYDLDGYHFRGKVQAEPGGCVYELHTARPGDYKISDPGQPEEFRCAHIHVIVTAEGYKPLTTQLYFPDDKFNSTDHWFSESRVIRGGTFDFVLEKDGGR